MAKFQKLAALKQFEIFNATFKPQVPACATDGATKRKFLFYFPARCAAPENPRPMFPFRHLAVLQK
jgi:hypothetical protein